MNAFWADRPVCVTGGAALIGSALVDRLVGAGARVTVADDLSSGRRSNLSDRVRLIEADLRDRRAALDAVAGATHVFHLAADHGGRGYIERPSHGIASNLVLDQMVFAAARHHRCENLVYASSGCVYPLHLQGDPDRELYLREDQVGPPYDPDGLYGMVKLAGEQSLRAMHAESGTPAAIARLFTVYGPRGVENHAVMAMIARAFIGQDPFEVWGTGDQVRNWTFVEDIARGLMLLAEHVDDARAVNLGTDERIRVADAARFILQLARHDVEPTFVPDAPTGPLNRVASNDLARELLGWTPQIDFAEGVRRTYEWYAAHRDRDAVAETLDRRLTERFGDAGSAA